MQTLSIDPGKVTGFALGHYTDDAPWTLDKVWVTHEGVLGFSDWYWNRSLDSDFEDQTTIMETFVLRDNPFLASLDGVEVIGFAKGLGMVGRWQSRTAKSFSRTDKKAADKLLKAHGLWKTGKQVGHTDGRDVNDAIIHALAYMKHIKHVPSMLKYFPEETE